MIIHQLVSEVLPANSESDTAQGARSSTNDERELDELVERIARRVLEKLEERWER